MNEIYTNHTISAARAERDRVCPIMRHERQQSDAAAQSLAKRNIYTLVRHHLTYRNN